MLMMGADGDPPIVFAATPPIHSSANPPYPISRLSKPPPLHFNLNSETRTHTRFPATLHTLPLLPTHRLLYKRCKHCSFHDFMRRVNTVAINGALGWETCYVTHTRTDRPNTAALSVNVNERTSRTGGASLMHLSWFSHQLTNLFMPSCWKTTACAHTNV